MHDDELWDLDEVCVYHGGLRPLDPSTVWKGIKAGRFSKPIYPTPQNPRWRRSDCERDRARQIAERDNNA
jgi:hypothetical protein